MRHRHPYAWNIHFELRINYCRFVLLLFVGFFSLSCRDLATKTVTPQFKDLLSNNLQPYTGYLPVVDCESMAAAVVSLQAPRHTQITQQYSSSTDEGCDTDHGEMDDSVVQSSVPPSIQRLNSYASSSSSSGVVTNFHSKSLSQNLSCESSRSNFSTFESLDLNLSDCSDLAASLPSCATSTAMAITDNINENGKPILSALHKHKRSVHFRFSPLSLSFFSFFYYPFL